MNNIIPWTILGELDRLEEKIQTIRYKVSTRLEKKPTNIVQKTAGLLGKDFPGGVSFENEVRKSWSSRTKKMGI